MASKSFCWNVRNIAKISPKITKKQSFFDIFRFSQKLSIRFQRNFCSHSTPYYGPLCAITSNSYAWESSESEGKRPKPTPLPHMRLGSGFLTYEQTSFSALNFFALWLCELFFFCPLLAVRSKLLLAKIKEAHPNRVHFGHCRKPNLGQKKKKDTPAGTF